MKYFSMVARLLCEFYNVVLRHILREFNKEANELAQVASNYKVNSLALRELIIVNESFVPFQEGEVYYIGQLDPSDWKKPIVKYVKNPNLPIDRKTRYRALSYVLLADVWYKKFVNGNLLTCLGMSEAFIALVKCMKVFAGPSVGEKMKWALT